MPRAAPRHKPMPRLAAVHQGLNTESPGKWVSDKVRGTRQQRGYGKEWQKLRAAVLERDAHLCQPCEREHRITLATEVDHIVPKAQGGQDEAENCQAICRACHKAKTAREH